MGKRVSNILGTVTSVILLLLFGALVAIQIPKAQTEVARKVLARLSDSLEGNLQIGDVNIRPSGAVFLKDVLVLDKEPYTEDINGRGWAPADTFFYAGSISATVSLKSVFSKHGISLGRVNIDNALFHLTTEPDGNGFHKSNIERIFHLKKALTDPDADPPGGPEIFRISKVHITDFNFRLNSFMESRRPPQQMGINYEDLDVILENLSAKKLKFAGGVMSGIAEQIEVTEKSGYRAIISGSCKAGMGKVLIDDLKIKDEWSDLDFRFLNMTFRNGLAFADFLNKVNIEARFRPSHVAITTVAYTGSAQLFGNEGIYDIRQGHVLGPVSDMQVEKFDFSERKSGLSGRIDVHLRGLPDVMKFRIDGKVRDVSFGTAGLSFFINSWSGNSKLDFSRFAPRTRFKFNATTSGLLNNLKVNGLLSSNAGSISIAGSLDDLIDKNRALKIIANASTSPSIDMGSILDSEALGEMDFSTGARLLLAPGRPTIIVDSLMVSRALMKGYEYKGLSASARLANDNLWARIESKDSNLVMKALANVDLKTHNGIAGYKLGMDVSRINTDTLGFTHTGFNTGMSFGLDVNLSADDSLYMKGYASLQNATLFSDEGAYSPGAIMIDADNDGVWQNVNVASDIFKLSLSSDKNILAIVPDFLNSSARRDLNAICPALMHPELPGNHRVELDFLNTGEITEVFFPGLYIERGTSLTAMLDDKGKLNASLSSGRIAWGLNYVKDLLLNADNEDGRLNANITGTEINTSLFDLQKPVVDIVADDNRISLSSLFHDKAEGKESARILLDATASRTEDDILSIDVHTRPSYIRGADRIWSIDESEINVTGKGLHIDRFQIHNDLQSLSVDGGINSGHPDTLRVKMENFDLSSFNQFQKKDLSFNGIAAGSAYLFTEPESDMGMLLNFHLDSLGISGTELGDFAVSSRIDDEKDAIILKLRNVLNGKEIIGLDGTLIPKDKMLDIEADIDGLNIKAAEPFLSNVFDEMGGKMSGRFFLNGKTDDIGISSEGARFENALLRISITGAPYILNGPFLLDNEGVRFEGIEIRDNSDGRATLNGSLNYRNFKDMNIDATLAFNKLKVVDQPEVSSDSFYGHMNASGMAKVSGPVNALFIDADVTTDGDGDIHIPLSGKLSSNKGQLLTYVDHSEVDPYELMVKKYTTRERVRSDMRVRASVGITEGLNALMEIDKSVGNIISFNGDGRVNLDLRPSKSQINLNGDYRIRNGKYHFVLPGLLEKDLNIKDGSSIQFGGDLMDSQIDISAIYNLKTSVATLISDTTKVSSRKSVDAGINISNKLSNPDISFFIDIPDLDPATKSRVDASLDTDDKVQKQFVALLLLGTFIPNDESGVFNGANMLYSNVGEIVSGQLNSILSRLNIPVDLGLSYQANNSGNNVFDVAVSTQLFNNRVTVSGNVGNRQYKPTSAASSDVVGDLDIEVKVDRNGKLRVKLFSHSADSYSNFLDNFQRNGIGLSYQKDFLPKKKEDENDKVIIRIE